MLSVTCLWYFIGFTLIIHKWHKLKEYLFSYIFCPDALDISLECTDSPVRWDSAKEKLSEPWCYLTAVLDHRFYGGLPPHCAQRDAHFKEMHSKGWIRVL